MSKPLTPEEAIEILSEIAQCAEATTQEKLDAIAAIVRWREHREAPNLPVDELAERRRRKRVG
jgi:serine phosphatase RsbU (regulator of sigma subunit)